MLRISEPLYAVLSEAGLPARKVALAAGTVVDFVQGHALTEDSSSPSEDAGFERDLLARLEAQPAESSPTMRRVFRVLAEDAGSGDPVSAFDGGLDILLEGIAAIASVLAGRSRCATRPTGAPTPP